MKFTSPGIWSVLFEGTLRANAALFFFGFVCVQAVLQVPKIPIIPGFRVNVFGGIMALLALTCALLLHPGARARLSRLLRDAAFWLTLLFLAMIVASSLASDDLQMALGRGFVFWATAAGGYWSARILLQGERRRRLFLVFCALLLAALLLGQLLGYVTLGSVHAYFDPFRHAQVCLAFLLLFAPLTLLGNTDFQDKAGGLLLLGSAGLVLYLSGLRTAVYMPVILVVLVLMLGSMKKRWLLLVLVVFLVLAASYTRLFPEKRVFTGGEPVYYRVENYPFSWHVTMQHPLLGIGLGADRTPYLDGYSIHYTRAKGPNRFAWSLRRINNAENSILSLMCGLGLPFTLLYCAGVGWVLFRLLVLTRKKALLDGLPALPLLLSLLAAGGHMLLFDGLLYPQLSFFFHILLGLAPLARHKQRPGAAIS